MSLKRRTCEKLIALYSLCTGISMCSNRTIAKEISAAKAPYTVQVLAYKNGDGRLSQPERLVSSSVPGIIEQATARLDLPQAARRVYMADGTLVLEVDDIVTWARENDVINARREIRAAKKQQRQAQETAATEQGIFTVVYNQ